MDKETGAGPAFSALFEIPNFQGFGRSGIRSDFPAKAYALTRAGIVIREI